MQMSEGATVPSAKAGSVRFNYPVVRTDAMQDTATPHTCPIASVPHIRPAADVHAGDLVARARKSRA